MNRQTWLGLGLFSLAAALFAALQAAEPANADKPGQGDDAKYTQQVRPLLQKYCIECHAGKKAKGGLELDTLAPDFKAREAAAAWQALADRVAFHSMPPRSKPQPTAEEAKTLAHWVESGLARADADRQRVEGRAVLRRLNRVEYENTVRDLLSIDVDLKHLLPEDDHVDGFDNIGSALAISSILMERYLEAADLALNAAIVRGPRPKTTQIKLSQQAKNLVTKNYWRQHLEKEEAAILLSTVPAQFPQVRPSFPGRYRVRISAYAYQNQGKTLVMRVWADGQDFTGSYHSVPADKSAVVEVMVTMRPRDTLQVAGHGLTSSYIRDVATHKGPGLAIEWVEVDGPLLDDWPLASQQRLLGHVDMKTAKAAEAEKVLREFIPRAFRRQVSEDQLRPYRELARSGMAKGYSFEEALRMSLRAVLCSPSFLFLQEKPGRLDDFPLASRLSYFLWKSMPDQELIDLAGKNRLRAPEELRRQVERMLKDPRAGALTQNFLGQWLDLRQIDATSPDKMLYPEFDPFLRYSMLKETELFFEEILKNDHSLLCLIDSDFAMLNERMARHYGIAGVEGPEFRKVQLPAGSHRGGVLTQAAVLKVTANGTVTSPVLRGVWVLNNILGQPPPPPPPDVPAIEPDTRGATSIRDQLAKHRKVEACASCHQKIDPPGFALESYDVIGGWRDNYRSIGAGAKVDVKINGNPVQYRAGPKVEGGDVMPDGQRFKDVDEFKKILLASPEPVVRCVTEKLLIYATGSSIRPGDRAAVSAIVERVRAKKDGLRALVHEIVQSDLFLHK